MSLAERKCVPCEGGVMPLFRPRAEELLKEIPGWALAVDGKSIARKYLFPDFARALAFVDRVGSIAEQEGHHPDIALSWGRVDISLSTHSIGGLSENDFVLAAKIDALEQ
jgi:4a-hydroxytetrahydrobiopterin dehydratase